jgi:hypothetical protein
MSTTAPDVTITNYVRAESDFQMRGYVEQMDCFGRLVHSRAPYDVHHQVTVRANRDTLYSFGVFDLTAPLTVRLPEPDGRYQSLMTVSQDHSIEAHYSPATVTLTTDNVGTRYVVLIVRTFADPNDDDDLAVAHALQDQITTEQAGSGVFEVPSWDQEGVEHMRSTLGTLAALATDSSKAFGRKEDLDPVYWALGAAIGWGGLPAAAAMYEGVHPDRNDGATPHTLTVGDVPCDAFWSVTLYDADGWMPVNDLDAYCYNNVTADRSADGTVTIHFGGDPDQSNFLPIVPGWNYVFRVYRPRPEVIDGTWTFPRAEPVG